MRIGFLGLGNMGAAMATNLLKAGHEMTVYNRSADKGDALVAQGAQRATAVADACTGDVVFSMLADDAAVEHVTFGDIDVGGGIVDSLAPGATHISASTISVALATRLSRAHADAGQLFVSAPVFGRPEAAEAAKLFVVAAGAASSVQAVTPLFDAIGQRTFVVAEQPEAANLVKLSGNFLIASVLESLGEAMALISKGGIDKGVYLEILTSTLFDAPVYHTYGGLIANQKYEPAGFAARLGLKDVRLALEAGRSAVCSATASWPCWPTDGASSTGRRSPRSPSATRDWADSAPSRLHDSAQPVGAEHGFQQRRVVRSAAQHLPTVDVDHLTGDPGRGIAEQKERRAGDVFDLTGPGQRCADAVILAELRHIEDRSSQFGANQSRPNAVHPHPGRAELVGRQLHQMIDGRLGHSVGAEPSMGIARGDRRDSDEGAAAAPDHLAR
jgi:3-hydroxyisobutyrate dehydrogenase-like beta-hydroxyacid dehydrogenase